jgi:DNA-binding transcriptional MerR regulator
MSNYLTTKEVAERARPAESTVRYWRMIGYGPKGFPVGRRVLYDAADVDSWLEGLKVAAHGAA